MKDQSFSVVFDAPLAQVPTCGPYADDATQWAVVREFELRYEGYRRRLRIIAGTASVPDVINEATRQVRKLAVALGGERR